LSLYNSTSKKELTSTIPRREILSFPFRLGKRPVHKKNFPYIYAFKQGNDDKQIYDFRTSYPCVPAVFTGGGGTGA
jgi:hypothetical protein